MRTTTCCQCSHAVHGAAGVQDVVNIAVVVGFDVALVYTCGLKSLAYLIIGTVMGGGLHPMAGHLIAEHYMFAKVPPFPNFTTTSTT